MNKDQKASRTQRLNIILEDKQNRSYFVAAVSFLFFLVFIIFGLLPAVGNVLSQNSENAKVKAAVADITQKRDSLISMKGELGTKADVLGIFDSAFPESNNQGEIVKLLYDLANYSEDVPVEDLSLIIKQTTFNDTIRRTPLQLDYKVGLNVKSSEVLILVEGDLAAILDFITKIETNSRVMNIKRSIINKRTGEVANQAEANRQYVLNLTIEYFYWGLPNESVTN